MVEGNIGLFGGWVEIYLWKFLLPKYERIKGFFLILSCNQVLKQHHFLVALITCTNVINSTNMWTSIIGVISKDIQSCGHAIPFITLCLSLGQPCVQYFVTIIETQVLLISRKKSLFSFCFTLSDVDIGYVSTAISSFVGSCQNHLFGGSSSLH